MLEKYVNSLNILYEDNHLLVVEKFINVLSQKDNTNDIDMTEIVKEYLKKKYNKPGNVYVGLIHRLDRRVGGVMVFAKTSKAASRLSEDIRNHKFQKRYLALALGEVDSGTMVDKIIKDEKTRLAKPSKDGKEAILNYQVINRILIGGAIHSYVKVELVTGRYNQIRFQFASRHHPLMNDYKYGYSLSRGEEIGLWCYEVIFTHPTLKKEMKFTLYPQKGIWDKLERGEK